MSPTRSCSIVAASLLCIAAADAPVSEVPALISEFVRHYRSGDLTEAAQLFHCPPSYTSAELEADREAIATSLRIMSDLYGPVRRVSEAAGSIYVAPTTACGTAGYLKAHLPTSKIHIRNTEQREAEQGYLVFHFSSVGGRAVLIQFGHGLPATHPEARSRAQSFLRTKLAQ